MCSLVHAYVEENVMSGMSLHQLMTRRRSIALIDLKADNSAMGFITVSTMIGVHMGI